MKQLKSLKLPKLDLKKLLKLKKPSTSETETVTEIEPETEIETETETKSGSFDKNKLIKATTSTVLLGFSGWFLWHSFLAVPEPELPAPHSLPQAAAVIQPAPVTLSPEIESIEAVELTTITDPDQMIDELLTVTGWHKKADEFPSQFLQGVQQSSNKINDPRIQAEIELLVVAAFEPALFKKHMHTSLKENFDQVRAERLLELFHQPWLQRITQLERQEVQPEALKTYVSSLTDTSLSEKRIELFHQYDTVVQLTEFIVELRSGMIRSMLSGIVDNDKQAMVGFDTELDQNTQNLHENMREFVLTLLAYVYRELSDDEFEAYITFITSDDSMWLNTTLMHAALEKLNANALMIGQQLAALCESTMPCDDNPSPEVTALENSLAPDDTLKQRNQYELTVRSNLDARECLDHTDNMAIHRCAENFR